LLSHLRRSFGADHAAGLEDAELLERFVTKRDETAFALILRRHGPMVLNVCQRFLSNSHDCEDAFQATFGVLVRKARTLRRRKLLANWLYGVAYRTALKARSQARRRRTYQHAIREVACGDGTSQEVSRLDLGSLLDGEVNRLPAKYRAPVILCYLEGKTFTEAAAQLGWPAGTVAGRLARARQLLRKRLERRDRALA